MDLIGALVHPLSGVLEAPVKVGPGLGAPASDRLYAPARALLPHLQRLHYVGTFCGNEGMVSGLSLNRQPDVK